jgi:hypothetical protein
MFDVTKEKAGSVPSTLGRGADAVGSAVSTLSETADRLIKERPIAVLLVALGMGWALARLMSRR